MGNEPEKLPEHCCAKCHFFCYYKPITIKGPQPFMLEPHQVDNCLKGNFQFLLEHQFLGCYHAVWKADKLDRTGQPLIPILDELKTNRRDFCFFYPKVDGMSFKAANTLEHREADRREADIDRYLAEQAADAAKIAADAANDNATAAMESAKTSKIAVWVAIVALFLNAFLMMANLANVQKVEIVSPYEQDTQENTVQKSAERMSETGALDDKAAITNR